MMVPHDFNKPSLLGEAKDIFYFLSHGGFRHVAEAKGTCEVCVPVGEGT